MITNINTLQHPTEDLQTVTDVYLKQSLANLGQRFSIKGDGLQTGELNLYEMFLRDYDKAIDEKAYCKIVVDNDSPDAPSGIFAGRVQYRSAVCFLMGAWL